jgi:hypothetical protein
MKLKAQIIKYKENFILNLWITAFFYKTLMNSKNSQFELLNFQFQFEPLRHILNIKSDKITFIPLIKKKTKIKFTINLFIFF